MGSSLSLLDARPPLHGDFVVTNSELAVNAAPKFEVITSMDRPYADRDSTSCTSYSIGMADTLRVFFVDRLQQRRPLSALICAQYYVLVNSVS